MDIGRSSERLALPRSGCPGGAGALSDYATVYISELLSPRELEGMWVFQFPKLVFEPVDEHHWRISFHPDHGPLRGILNIVPSLRTAIRRRHARATVK
jgi:hypothetical protein